MKVVIQYSDGSYGLRQFKEGIAPTSFAAPPDWEAGAVFVPDHVVDAYCYVAALDRTMQTVLGMYDEVNGKLA
jgi:hypothetical protein